MALGAVVVTGVATAVEGMRFAHSASNGAVPLEDGDTPAPETPEHSARLKRRVTALGTANAVAELALVGVNAALGQASFRRPPARRLLRRRY